MNELTHWTIIYISDFSIEDLDEQIAKDEVVGYVDSCRDARRWLRRNAHRKYNGEICGNLRPSEFIDNSFSYVLDIESLYRMPRSLSLEEQEQLNNIPLSVFTHPELYIGKPIPPKPSVLIKEI